MGKVKEIKKTLLTPPLSYYLQNTFGKNIRVNNINMECLKKTRRISVWKIQLKKKSMILKIYTSQTKRNKNEINFLKQHFREISSLMPKIYWTGSPKNNDEIWILMEYVQQLRGQIKMHPDYFMKIIPAIAKLHATTFEGSNTYKKIAKVIPIYHSKKMMQEREKLVNKTTIYLKRGIKEKHLGEIINPYYEQTLDILKKGPDFFPELTSAGECIIHGDLHLQNICCNNILEKDWHIQFIDWETARCSSGWIDLAILVEVLLDFRKDWQKHAQEIRHNCVRLYTEELNKYGIIFKTNPMKLFKMAYLQRTLEKGLYTHLRRELQGRRGVLLETYLQKINTWGLELGL